MTAFANHFGFELRSGIRNKNLLLLNYLFPIGLYLMMSFIMPSINPMFRDAIIPAMVIIAILAATALGMPDPLVSAREAGIFRSYKINGVPATAILFIPSLATLLHLTVVMAFIVVSAPLLFDAPAPTNWANFLIVFYAMAFASAGLGVLIGVISQSTRLTVLWSQLIFLPSMLIGGLMIPYTMLPESVGRVARLLPATYASNALSGLAMGQEAAFSPWGSVLILLAGGVLGFAAALYLFRWDGRNPLRHGAPLVALLALAPYLLGVLIF